MFSNLTIDVITKAIDLRRDTIYKNILEIRDKGGGKETAPIAVYPVEAAVKDAIRYHGSCSFIAGLEEAGTSLEKIRDPGLKTLNDLHQTYPHLFKSSGQSPSPSLSAPTGASPSEPTR